MGELVKHISGELGNFGQSILSFSVASLPILFVILLYLVLVPVLVFFFLKDSENILSWLGSILPKKRPVMSKIWVEMNQQILPSKRQNPFLSHITSYDSSGSGH